MKKAFGDYRFLTGGGRTRGSLWEGPDHLLCIESEGFLVELTESYRRIDYAKIQAITYGRTRVWAVMIVCQMVLAALFSWPVIHSINFRRGVYIDPSDLPVAVMGGLALLITLVALIVNLVKGPTCVCKVQTAVQSLRLKPVVRVKEARKLAGKIAVLCQQHQESVVTASSEAGSPVDGAFVSSMAPLLQTKAPFTGSPLMRWGFLLLLLGGGMTAGEVFVNSLAYFLADVTFASAGSIMLVIALIRSTQVELPPVLKGTLWAAVINFIFGAALGFGLYIYASISITEKLIRAGTRFPMQNDVSGELLKWLAHVGFDELGWCAWLVVVVGAINVLLALLGLPSVLHYRPSVVSPPPLPASVPSAAAEFEPPSAP